MTGTKASYAGSVPNHVETQSRDEVVVPMAGTPTIGSSFDARHNSLNFLRLLLAIAVVFSHALTIGNFGTEDVLGKTTLGTVAVYGFFGLSGYLITASASRNNVGRFLWQRFLRIYPAFWVCLVVTAFVFGTIVWWHANPQLANRCGFACYRNEPGGPETFVLHNLSLWIPQSTIAHTLPLGYFRPVWNGSLWTLLFECACYVMVATLSVFGLLRRRLAVLILAGSVWSIEILMTSVPSLNQHFSPSHHWYIMKMMTFVPVFLGGALIYLYREKVPDAGVLAGVCTLVFLSGLVLPLGNSVPTFRLTSIDLTSPLLIYPLVWLGIHLPFQKVGARNDYSYGIYIYAYPVQQLLVVWGLASWGYWPYAMLSSVAVLPMAMASWWVVEKHVLRWKTLGTTGPRARSVGGEPEQVPRHAGGPVEAPADVYGVRSPGGP